MPAKAFYVWLTSFRIPRTVGILLFLIALGCYRSPENPLIFGRWSGHWFALLALTTAALLGSAIHPLLQERRRDRAGSSGCKASLGMAGGAGRADDLAQAAAGVSRSLFGFGVLFHGLAFLLMVLDQPSAAGGIRELRIWGAVTPGAAAIGWLALLLTALAGIIRVGVRLPSSLREPGLAVGSILLLLVVGEGLARIYVLASPAVQGSGALTTRAWMRRYVELNRLGFRDREHPLRPPPGTRRLLVLGDSFAYGWGIRETNDRFGEQLAAALARRTGETWTSMNASHPGTHTLQHEEYLRRMLPYRPDLVVLLYVFNDIEYLEDTGYLSLATRQPLRSTLSNFYFAGLIHERVRVLAYSMHGFRGPAFGDERKSGYRNGELLHRHLDDLKRLVRIARIGGAKATIAPFDPDVKLPGVYESRYRPFTEQARSAGLPVADTAGAFEPYAYRELVLSNLDRHPSAMANALIADALAAQLAPTYSPPATLPSRYSSGRSPGEAPGLRAGTNGRYVRRPSPGVRSDFRVLRCGYDQDACLRRARR